jgi:type II secretory pathway predicted ATPase ExeA
MYRPFYGFSRLPFERDLPADLLFRVPALDELHARLCYLADTRGIGLLYSEPGCGKTTALRRFKEALHPDQVRLVYLYDTTVNAADLYRQLAMELGIEPRWRRSMTFRAVQEEIVRLATERRLTVLLVIDEAHRLRPDVLAELPLLTNFEMDSGARLALLLCGQVGLRQRLRMAELEPLAQRVTVRFALRGLDRDGTRLYLEHRLRVAGVDRPLFSEPAIEAIFNASQGVFRRIDGVAHHALAAGAAARARIVDADHVVSAAEEIRA